VAASRTHSAFRASKPHAHWQVASAGVVLAAYMSRTAREIPALTISFE
jgi:hypothetical protein